MTHYTLFQIARLATRIDWMRLLEILIEDYPHVIKAVFQDHPGLIRQPKPLSTLPEWSLRLIEHIRKNETVSAIKLLRKVHGWGLKEAKDVNDVICGMCTLDEEYLAAGTEQRIAALPKGLAEKVAEAFNNRA